jgi:diphthine-ammonia ligase
MQEVFVSWSGGKDSCFACYLAVQSGRHVANLLNMITRDGSISWSHRISTDLLRVQAQAIDIPLIQHPTTSEEYEKEFKAALTTLKAAGVTEGVFGDIDFELHREWIERVCRDAGITPSLPLWGRLQEKIMEDFVAAGFEAIVVVTKAELMGQEWLGRKVDRSFIRDLRELGKTVKITPCGEAGEYHTLVVDGPLFQKRVQLVETDKVLRDGYWFLDIAQYGSLPKPNPR